MFPPVFLKSIKKIGAPTSAVNIETGTSVTVMLLEKVSHISRKTAPNEMRAVMSISTAPCIHRGMGTEYREKGEKLRGHSLVQLQKISEMLLRKNQKMPGACGRKIKNHAEIPILIEGRRGNLSARNLTENTILVSHRNCLLSDAEAPRRARKCGPPNASSIRPIPALDKGEMLPPFLQYRALSLRPPGRRAACLFRRQAAEL